MTRLGLISLAFASLALLPFGAQAQDLQDFRPTDCALVPIPSVEDAGSPVLHVNWCGGGGAGVSVDQQIANGAGETCGRYSQQLGWGALTQAQLFNLAVLHAKDGQFNLATEESAACNCHNPPIAEMIRARSRELVCWLRQQP